MSLPFSKILRRSVLYNLKRQSNIFIPPSSNLNRLFQSRNRYYSCFRSCLSACGKEMNR